MNKINEILKKVESARKKLTDFSWNPSMRTAYDELIQVEEKLKLLERMNKENEKKEALSFANWLSNQPDEIDVRKPITKLWDDYEFECS